MTPRSMDKAASRVSDRRLAELLDEQKTTTGAMLAHPGFLQQKANEWFSILAELQSLRSLSSDSVSDGSKERLATLCSEWPMWLHDAVTHATDLADKKDWSTEQVVGYAILSALDSGTGEQQPVAWRGQHSHPKALGKWVYVDGPEKPKSLIGGLGLLEPLYSSPTEPKAGVVSELPRYHFDSGQHTWGTDSGSMNETSDGEWVKYSDLTAALNGDKP